MKLVLLCLVALVSTCSIVLAAKKKQANNRIQHESIEFHSRPKTKNFGMPRTALDAPIGSHDFSHSDENFNANREALEFTQLTSGTNNPKVRDPNADNPLAALQQIIENGQNLVENTLDEQLGLQVPTKTIEGSDQEYGLEIIKMATAMLKDLIATPRHQSRLPLGISHRSRQISENDGGESANTTTPDVARLQRKLLGLVEQLTKLALDETNLQDPAFGQLLDQLSRLVLDFRTSPTLRT